MTDQPTLIERLAIDDAVLSRTDLRDLGYGRQAVDRIFQGCPVIALPESKDGTPSRRPLIRVADFHAFIARHTFRDGKDVR